MPRVTAEPQAPSATRQATCANCAYYRIRGGGFERLVYGLARGDCLINDRLKLRHESCGHHMPASSP